MPIDEGEGEVVVPIDDEAVFPDESDDKGRIPDFNPQICKDEKIRFKNLLREARREADINDRFLNVFLKNVTRELRLSGAKISFDEVRQITIDQAAQYD